MIKSALLSLIFTFITISTLTAAEYKIAVPGSNVQSVGQAVRTFEEKLSNLPTDASLRIFPGVFAPKEFLELLKNKDMDFAVVPYRVVPDLANSPLLEPFLAENATKIRQAINSEVGANDIATMEKKGFRILDIWHVSSSIFSSKQPVQSVQALQGLKFRVAPNTQVQTLERLGARPQAIAFADVFDAISRGSVDSTPLPLGVRNSGFGLYDVVDYYVDRTFQPILYAVMIKSDRWEELPFPDQYFLAKAARETGESLVKPLDQLAAQFRIDAQAQGARFADWNAEDVQAVRLASLAAVNPDIKNAAGQRTLVDRAFESASAEAAPPPDGERIPASENTILFATDRVPADINLPETAFSAGRTLRGHKFGKATVALKDTRKLGSNLEKVAEIKSLETQTKEQFEQILAQSGDKDVVVYVHGYNNGFTDSIRRGATIQQDIARDAIIISYTWPSDGAVLSYAYDESSTEIALQNIKIFMDMLTAKVAANRIHIVAHSMGSRLVTEYIANLPERGQYPDKIKFKNLIFAAPDIATQLFQQKEEEPFYPPYPLSVYADRITVYSSKDDMPLGLSHKLHGDQRLGRADQSSIYLEADIIAIDASKIDPKKFHHNFTFATRHSYVFDKQAGVRDLSLLIQGELAANRPNMTPETRDGLQYWVLSP